jgi:hypothetical protein
VGFRTLSGILKKQRFGNWNWSGPRVEEWETPTLSDPFVFFFSLALQPNSGLGRLHETFRFTSVTRSRTPWTGDQLVARPLRVHKH